MDSPSGMPIQSPLAKRYGQLCDAHGAPDVFAYLREHRSVSASEQAAICAIDQAHRWRCGTGFPAEWYLERLPEVGSDERLKLKLIAGEFQCQLERGLEPSIEIFLVRFPEIRDSLRAALSDIAANELAADPISTVVQYDEEGAESTPSESSTPGIDKKPNALAALHQERIGRYRILRILGDGGFGRVYLAHDDELHRNVAIKVPHAYRISRPADVDAYFEEARILASLDHRTIVPIFDFGRTEDGRCFAVSKYIEGSDLATKAKHVQLTFAASAELVASIAEGLHYAHLRGIVHRDIKPANILIDKDDRPYLADFGIALREEDFGRERPTAGTPAYMSPEQARGEGHLVDGRTDIFSLGIVLYELLTGRRPFGKTIIDRMHTAEARPPRQIHDSIPQELERICLKALSQRVADRYNTAGDMAADLREFIAGMDVAARRAAASPLSSNAPLKSTGDVPLSANALTIVPKGLRSFDRDDADFFLELLPGPRDRDGLPESVRFWKSQILEHDAEEAFRVGVIYGPSGCGKSSFLKAGVVPRLAGEVSSAYVESTALDTELRLLKALRKCCPTLPQGLGLVETMTALRCNRDLRAGSKVLIILDQFEQWLHARGKDETSDLVPALRQCDGIHVQCIVAVRDDFWMAVTHFMNDLEVSLIPGRNIAALDLFSTRHARKILTALGGAYGMLPVRHDEMNERQKTFVERAVKDLARNDQVIPVQLALFAEMVKDKPWTPSTLKDIGGAEGVGMTFLEETFNGRTANPNHRLHQKAASEVLKLLLSAEGGGIKGRMRSHQELLEASGYAQQPQQFAALLHVLDSELRLITPTDPEGLDSDSPVPTDASAGSERYYHLTHDYLVPSLSDWLARKQKQTRRGRAELLLAERAEVWGLRPTSRSLPSFVEWLQILAFTRRRDRVRKEAERKLMHAANRYHLGRLAVVVALAAIGGFGTYELTQRIRERSLVASLRSAAIQEVPDLIRQIDSVRSRVNPLLISAMELAPPDSRARLHLSLALLPVDREQQDGLYERMLTESPETSSVIQGELRRYGDAAALTERLWSDLSDPNLDATRRFRAGAALAGFSAPSSDADPRWKSNSDFLADALVRQIADNPNQFAAWTAAFFPARSHLSGPLAAKFSDDKRASSQREIADAIRAREISAAILADYIADQPQFLVRLLLEATPQQHRAVYPALERHRSEAIRLLSGEFDRHPTPAASAAERSRIAGNRARAAVLLFELDEPNSTWTALQSADDADLYSTVEERLSSLAIGPATLLGKLQADPAPVLKGALLRSLAGMPPQSMLPALREECLSSFAVAYRTDPDPGVHSAAEWGLKMWGASEQLDSSKRSLASGVPNSDRNWYVNGSLQTLAIFRGPITVRTGSPSDEERRELDEGLSIRRINRDFALGTTEVTIEQFKEFIPEYRHTQIEYSSTDDCPVVGLTWHRAAEYCVKLSRSEGIPDDEMCFREVRQYVYELYPDYLARTGYRLATEAEWEYACRAGATTAYSWGNSPVNFRRFAWTIEHSGGRHWSVGTLCPNRFGMFDMHGNVNEWVLERYRETLPESEEDVEEKISTLHDSDRTQRGAGARDSVGYNRAANRRPAKAYTNPSFSTGFRIARTIRRPKSPQQ